MTDEGIAAVFLRCEEIGSETEVIELETLDKNGKPRLRKIPGRQKTLNVRCRQGVSFDRSLSEWRELALEGAAGEARQNYSLSLVDAAGWEIAVWQFTDGWPNALFTRVLPIGLVFGRGQVTIVDEIVLTHEGVLRSK